jgi:hypothetical protein
LIRIVVSFKKKTNKKQRSAKNGGLI